MRRPIVALAAGAAMLVAAPAVQAHSGHVHKGMSEKQLRAFETRVLGPAHAKEHAEMRALLRDRKEMAKARKLKVRPSAKLAAVTGPGRWNAPFDLPVFAINSVVLHTGKVMIWAYPFGNSPDGQRDLPPERNSSTAYLWDPSKGTGAGAFKEVPPPKVCPNNPNDPTACTDDQKKPANIWCSGQSLLADGRVLVTGGNLEYETTTTYYKGLNLVFTFNPDTETWQQHESMAKGRWYPTQTTLPDGRVLIMSGVDESGSLNPVQNNPDVELFDPNAPVGQEITRIGARGAVGSPPNGEPYPHVFTMPNGTIMVTGPYAEDTWGLRWPIDLGNWFDFGWDPAQPGQRYAGNAVLDPADPNRIMLVGGGEPGCSPTTNCTTVPLATTTILDSTDAAHWTAGDTSHWTAGPSLNKGRSHANTVLLPDGGMVVVGGGVGATGTQAGAHGQWEACPIVGTTVPVCDFWRPEIYDPDTKRWTLGPPQTENRAYHSTAVLLPDGGVLSAGDDLSGRNTPYAGFNGDTGEVYEPEYMGHARPTITSAPERMGWGYGYTVSGVNVRQVVLMAPSAVTHGVDMNQRRLVLNFDGQKATAPKDAFTAPPGYYMMFALDANGVPSLAKWVQVGNFPPEVNNPPQPPGETPGQQPPATGSGGGTGSAPGGATGSAPGGGTGSAPGGGGTSKPGESATFCGNLNAKKYTFYPATTTKGITAFSVTAFKTGCGPALTLIVDRHLKGYKKGKRSARGYRCASGSIVKSRGLKLRAISCRAGSRVVKWRVKA